MIETKVKNKAMRPIEIVGLVLVAASLLTLFFKPEFIAGMFDSMVNKAFPTMINVFLTGKVGVAIIVSVMIGRLLERLGFTDALMRIFVPIMGKIGVNSAVVIPTVYNILGDINAAGRIAAPIMKKAGATKDEQKIAIATMVQSQQSFSTFMFGIVALTLAGIKVFPVILLVVFMPMVIVPILLSKTIWRDTRSVAIEDMPSFTPNTSFLPTLFGAAREGAELLFLLIIPAVGVIFALIGALEFIGIWQPVEAGLSALLIALSIEPTNGMIAILASPTLAMAQVSAVELATTIDPALVLGAFVLCSSGFPLSVILGQIPVIWGENSDLSQKEALIAAVLGAVMRLITAGVIAIFFTRFFI